MSRAALVYSPDRDIYDGAPWTKLDLDDLRAHLEHGGTIETAAELLCRQGSLDDVCRKAEELA